MSQTTPFPPVVVLYTHSASLVRGEPQDIIADQDIVICAHAVEAALRELGLTVAMAPVTGEVEEALRDYPATEWVVFNLAEGVSGRLFEEVRIAWVLEAMGYRYTGSDATSLAITTHKARAKACLRSGGVATPDWRLFRDPAHVTDAALQGVEFPLFVKPVAEDASLGINAGAVVRTTAALRDRVADLVEHYRQAALAEVFVAGREFNLSLWGRAPSLLPLAEIDFGARLSTEERIVTFAAKWEPESDDFRNTPVTCPAEASPALCQRIADIAFAAWRVLGCSGYARVDLRVDGDGRPWVVEVNCNPCISPDAGFTRSARVGGYDYARMVERILLDALERYQE